MTLPTTRKCYVIGFLACVFMLGFAVFLQIHQGLEPCPLCQLQRIMFVALGIIFLFAMLQNPGRRGIKGYGYVIFIIALIGAAISLRHMWLQNTPHFVQENCGVGLNYLLQALPLTEAIRVILQGTGECAQVHWRFLGLTIPAWSLVGYTFLGLLGIWQNFRVARQY